MYCCHCEKHGNINSSYECPAKGETCRKCNRTDHIEVKLDSKKINQLDTNLAKKSKMLIWLKLLVKLRMTQTKINLHLLVVNQVNFSIGLT